ncbi:hypothetical protein JIG36_39185 [Actinoplanes sp. LDG1-06]|uniref:Uncharacterized protein n=1 Tax=Paractinoplanes ovalisporus TaxID=2810368 RepID=A0ABS2ANX1_9ACTN|nr:hypothetical protein [Actinoplanes ovalisporus]MBM2621547.1 hypothetical protein [Actinoplanes ovalisporus]
METALHSFFVSIPQAAALWLVILLAIAVAAVYVALPRSAPPRPLTEAERDKLRFADEVAVAAERAAATAARLRAEWATAQEQVDAAWLAFDEADRRSRETTQAAAFPLMSRRRKPGENADRQRYLHHAAIAACRNREISMAQLNDVLAHRGWNPRLHPVVQEGLLRNAIRAHRMSQYEDAQKREQAAWVESELAADALRSLRAEAAAAIVRSATAEEPAGDEWFADQWATGEMPATKAYA